MGLKRLVLLIMLQFGLFIGVTNNNAFANIPPIPPEEKENPQEVWTPIIEDVYVGDVDMGGMEIVRYEKKPLKDDCGCPTGKFEYIPVEEWVEDWQPVYESQIVDYTVTVECIELKIPFGRPVYQPLVQQPYFFIRYDKPSERIFSPNGMFFSSPFTSYIQTDNVDVNGDRLLTIIKGNGDPIEFTIESSQSSGAPSGKYAGNPATIKMLNQSGTAVNTNHYYYEIDFGNGVTSRYTESDGKIASITSAEGVILSPSDKTIGIEIIRDSAGSLRQIYSMRDGLADIVVPDGYAGIKYEIRLYAHGEFGTKGSNGLYTINQDGSPHTVWTIEDVDPVGIDKIRFTKTRGTNSTVYNWEYTDASEKWVLNSAGLKTMSKSKEWNEDKTELLTTVKRKNSDGTLVIQEYENLHKYAFGTRPYKKTVGAKSGETGPKLEKTIEYYTDSSATGKYGKEKLVIPSSNNWERYDYDSTGRKIKIEKPVKNAASTATSGIVTITQSYSSVDTANDTPLANDTRPRTIEEKIDGITVKKLYFVYYTNTSGEKVEITEAAATPTAAYGATGNVRKTEVYYAPTTTAPAAGRIKYVIYPDGKKDTFTYEFGTISNPSTPDQVSFSADPDDGTCIRVTTIHGTTTNDNGIAYKSTKETGIINDRGDIVLKETYVFDGSAYSRISWEYRVFDSEHHITSTYASNNTQEDSVWNCCNMESNTDRDGTEYTYTYDALGRTLTKTRKGVSGSTSDVTTTYTYDAANRVLSESVSDGTNTLATSKTYDICGRLTSETDSSGLTTTIAYTSPDTTTGMIITRTLPGGYTKITEKYFDGRVKSITGTAVVAKYYDYGVESSTGHQWTKESMGSSSSSRWTKTYKNTLGKVAKIEKSGYNNSTITKQFYYNSKGQLYKETETGLAATLYEYDSLGNQIKVGLDVNANGTLDLTSSDRINEISTLYSQLSSSWWLVSTEKTYATINSSIATTVSIEKTRLTGLANGTISETKTTDIHGNETTSTTTVNRLTKTVTEIINVPDSSTDIQTITVNGFVTSKRSMSNLTYTYIYDGLGRQTGINDPRKGLSTTAYYSTGTGKIGKVYTITDAANNTTTCDYDTVTGRLLWVQNALNKKTYYKYNNRGQTIRIWGDSHRPIENLYSNLGQITTLKTYRAGTGWTGSVWPTDTTGTADITTWTYDASSGLLTSKTFADSNSVNYTYTNDGKLYVRTWARTSGGNPLTTTYSYDSNTGEQTGIDYSDSTQDITFSYTRTGQKYQVVDSVGTRTFAYNTALQPSTETIVGGLYSKTLTNNYATTGVVGRYTGMNIGTEYVQTLGYDTYGRQNSVSSGTDTFTYSYLANSDLIASIIRPNNLTTNYSYETNRNLLITIDNKYNTTTTISSYGYVNDAIRRRTSKSRTGTAFTTADTITIGYNDRNEVTSAASNNIPAYSYGYAFDNIGNRSSYTASGTTSTYTANNLNQYSAITQGTTINPTYDADGGMLTLPQITGGTWNNTWNCENRLIETYNDTAGKKLEFTYDYMGRRVEKKVYTGTSGTSWTLSTHERFVYDDYKCIEVLDGANSNAMLQKFLWDDEEILSVYDVVATATYYYFTDVNKNIGQLMDSSGNTVAKYEYSPFGVQTLATGTYASTNPLRFSSEYYDSETGLVYFNFRYYSPLLGRWLSRDPIAEEGGWNLYLFVDNDSTNWIDELGSKKNGSKRGGSGSKSKQRKGKKRGRSHSYNKHKKVKKPKTPRKPKRPKKPKTKNNIDPIALGEAVIAYNKCLNKADKELDNNLARCKCPPLALDKIQSCIDNASFIHTMSASICATTYAKDSLKAMIPSEINDILDIIGW